jgi:hypothetical protein
MESKNRGNPGGIVLNGWVLPRFPAKTGLTRGDCFYPSVPGRKRGQKLGQKLGAFHLGTIAEGSG